MKLTIAAAAVSLTGVFGVNAEEVKYPGTCPENEAAGIPRIVCQPMDQKVSEKSKAVLEVTAVGQNLSYQWFFENTNGVSPLLYGTNAQLVVPGSDVNRFGFYWATVTSGGWLPGQEIQTRMATLTQTLSTSTNGPDQEPLRLGSNGTARCCSGYCGYVNFYNGSIGWNLALSQVFTFSVNLTSTGLPRSTTLYCVQWYNTLGATGCCTVSNLTNMRFVAPAASTYVFTAYLTGSCPVQGTLFTLTPH